MGRIFIPWAGNKASRGVGFLFGFEAVDRKGMPPVATGGRYDALTRAIGGGSGVPAVGGVIRPGLTLKLGGVS